MKKINIIIKIIKNNKGIKNKILRKLKILDKWIHNNSHLWKIYFIILVNKINSFKMVPFNLKIKLYKRIN